MKVRLDNENDTVWADFSILKKGKQYYGCLDFDKSMIRYADKRYLNVELILEDQSGLKIPKSSVIKKIMLCDTSGLYYNRRQQLGLRSDDTG